MLGTFTSFLVMLGASAAVGQAIFAVCGRRAWSHLAPAVGLAAILALCWATVRLPGHGAAALIALALVTGAASLFLRGRIEDLPRALRVGGPIALAALVAASLPFIVEARFGILGTGLNPDMSQHLFATDRLLSGDAERLISDGYPLGPHSLVAAVSELGPNTVHAFDGLMLTVAVITCLAALAAFERLRPWHRVAGTLLVGFAYLLASNFVQGAFKEALEALFVLAFAIGLCQLARDRAGPGPRWARAVPLAVLAVGAVYTYSFPGLLWLAGAAGIWALAELGGAWRAEGREAATAAVKAALPATAAAVGLVVIASAPELGRMIDFASFETFDPSGGGLGNLFNRISPLEALGIWPSGDFRVEPGDGEVPAFVFYLGAAFAAAALSFGFARAARRREWALPAALAAAVALWLYALLAGTPYQEAKALVIVAPLIAMISVGALLRAAPVAIAAAFMVAAGGSSALALVNGPVGPTGYSPALAELRTELGDGSVLVLAPRTFLDDEHGRDYLLWELRGNRVCVEPVGHGSAQDPGISTVIEVSADGAVVPVGTYRSREAVVPGPCPLIPDSARADPSAAGG